MTNPHPDLTVVHIYDSVFEQQTYWLTKQGFFQNGYVFLSCEA